MKALQSIYNDDLPKRAVAVYQYLYARKNKEDVTWPSIKTIAVHLKLSRSTVKRALSDLKQAGYIEVIHRRRGNGSKKSSLYIVKEPSSPWL